MFTPAITASSVSPPALMTSIAFAQQFTPPLLRLALEITIFLGLACAFAIRIERAAQPPRASRPAC